jgi:Collagen triple helix repeat (20 copies)
MKRGQLVAVGLAAALVLGGGVAAAATEAPVAVKACVSKSGTLSLLSNGKCAKGSSLVRIGVQGPRGFTGKTGAAGAHGANGTNGTNGVNGTNGTNGAVGPSDVYAWQGSLTSSAPTSSHLELPVGSYVIRWQGWFDNSEGNSLVIAHCDLVAVGTSKGEDVAVPAGEDRFDSDETVIQAVGPVSAFVTCPALGPLHLVDVELTATAAGTIHGNPLVVG